ncbi:DUF2924 domain-containing protein [Hyphomonas sp.]|uniref:DUF2924 domain-containing protein n=1 Tax=Alphaproteobacteria TaxID=28211 RepID=UPI00326600A7
MTSRQGRDGTTVEEGEERRPFSGKSDQPDALTEEIRQLSTLDMDGLRIRWRKETRRPAPAHLSKGLLLRMLAYRIQAAALGDLDRETRKALDRFARDRRKEAAEDGKAKSSRPARTLKPGTVLVREWDGQLHRVTVTANGYAWNGETFASLSTVAKSITGTSWSGPRFFGLVDKKGSRRRSPADAQMEEAP